ncbi:hypothetical protein T10_1319 [Trichinella papuae]|uniref:Uncharacterized protein n=1 Tax=Trichinella papuae TaxID=268474 RepID=A0A0V1MXF1_9BILA|nr:hypothetical protein T10_1319 [Trichinella papuae]
MADSYARKSYEATQHTQAPLKQVWDGLFLVCSTPSASSIRRKKRPKAHGWVALFRGVAVEAQGSSTS